MVSFKQYEELCLIFARMDKCLPSSGPTTIPWPAQPAVIEAKPLSLSYLAMRDDTWRFKGDIPQEHQKYHHRRWYIRESTRQATDALTDSEVSPTRGPRLPPGASLWHASDNARRLILLASHDAGMLLEEQLHEQTLPCANGWRTDGWFTLFSTPGPEQLLVGDCTRLLQPLAPYMTRLIEEYAKSLCWMYGLTPALFDKTCRVHVRCFPARGGVPMQLMESSSNSRENGPVVFVGIGTKTVTHDLSPTIADHAEHNAPIRLTVPEGTMVCLDGATRLRYSHGHPTRCASDRRSHWFMLTFFMDCTEQSTLVGFEGITRIAIMQSPIHPGRVVATTPRVELPLRDTKAGLINALINKMQARLRTAESLALAGRYDKGV